MYVQPIAQQSYCLKSTSAIKIVSMYDFCYTVKNQACTGPVALAIIELDWFEDNRQLVSQSVSRKFYLKNQIIVIILKSESI